MHFMFIFRCSQPGCDSLVRPHVVWFGEALEEEILEKTDKALHSCDVCLLVGTLDIIRIIVVYRQGRSLGGARDWEGRWPTNR